MAKSIRSKHGRKMRAAKRTKHEHRLDARLKRLTQNDKEALLEQASVVTLPASAADDKPNVEPMDTTKQRSKFNSRTRRDADGNYPEWMNQRAIHTLKKRNKTAAKNKGKNRLKW